MTPFWQSAAVGALGVAALGGAALMLAVARRSHANLAELIRRVNDLSTRVRALEHSPGATGGSPTSAYPPRALAVVKPPAAPGVKAHRVDPPAASAFTGPMLIAVPSMTAPGSGAKTQEAAEALERRFRPVWDLADSGRPAEAIARETGQPIGQVELILALRRQAGAAVSHG